MKKSFHHFILGLSFLCGLLLTSSLIETGDPLKADNLLSSTLIFPAFGQETEPIDITTDKFSYSTGDTIIVSGQVNEILQGFPVSMQVIAPNDNIVSLQQLTVGPDKKFSTEIVVGGPLWKSGGEYTIKVLYGTENITDEITITYDEGSASGPESFVSVEGTDFQLNYSISGGVLLSIIPDPGAISLNVIIVATSDGEFIITLPRELIDSKKMGGHDSDFFVLVDGEEVAFNEIPRQYDRTLEISFPAGAEEIEFIGTELVNTASPPPPKTPKVENKPPVIVYKYDKPVYVREQVTIDFSDSYDPEGEIESSKLKIESAVYHDITTFDATFESPGKKDITITLTDKDDAVVEESFTIQVLPAKSPDPDLTLIIIVVGVAVAVGVAGFAIYRSRKSSTSETIAKTVSDSSSSDKGRKCNVCGTVIPEGKNVCPNCGDTYS